MLELCILKVDDPGCFWGRIVKGAGVCVEDPKEYEELHIQMNLFYHKVNLDIEKMRLPSLEEGQVCVVYSGALKSWCRAVLESLFQGADGCQALCFLVDHAKRISVNADKVLAPLEKFLQLPFWVRKFQLSGIHPMTLQVSDSLEKAELVPSSHWDTSATRYFRNLLQASTLMEAVLCDEQAESTAVELYLTIENMKISVNDELVIKKFACFSSKTGLTCLNGTGRGFFPDISACDIFSSPGKFLSNDCGKRSTLPSISPRTDSRDVEPEAVQETDVTRALAKQEVYHAGQEEYGLSLRAHCPKLESVQNGREKSEKTEAETALSAGDFNKAMESCNERIPGTSSTEQLSQDLNLRFRKFLNPLLDKFVSKVSFEENILEAAGEEAENNVSPLAKQSSALLPEEVCAVAGDQSKWAAFPDPRRIQEEVICGRLLQFLHPAPLVLDSESSALTFGEEPRMDVLIHSAIDIQPCNSLASAPLTEDVQKALSQWSYSRPGVTECYCWPMVARGCDTLIVSSNGDDPLSYLPPFLTHLTHLMLSSVYSTLTSHTGPIAVILCPGWKKSQHLSDMLEISAARSLNPLTILVGHRREEAKSVKIKNCQLLVTTPFSLVRLLVFHTFLFLRLCHLVLDEVDVLYTRAPEEMSTILQHFEKVAASEERTSMPRQIIAAGRRWSHHAETLLTEHMRDPCVIITAPEEAALYGKVHQIVLLCLDDTKISTLPLCLNFASDVAQKTLIITNSMDEVEQVFTAVSSRGLFAWKLHEKLIYQFDVIIDQWRKVNDPGTHIVLVTTNHCVKALDIQDATCIVHYGFPSTPKQFGQRLFYMSKNFGNLSDKDRAEKLSHSAKSVLLLSEYNASHINGILRYMERANAVIPHELQDFAKGVMQAKEKQKAQRPLCSHLKSFGFCRDCRVCPDRHTVDPVQDAPQHINSRTITILPLYIKNASCYYGRLVSGKKDGYNSLAAQMAEHYAIERLHATKVVEGGIYALQEEDVYHRVRVQAVMERGERLFYSVLVCFLDEGHQKEVKAHQLLILPSQFQILPPQAVEIIVCRVQPIDGEVDWNPKVSWHISQKIKGVQHQGKIVLCLGNTVWVDPMVRITSMPGLKTTINEYDIHSEILATGMGTNNPQHVVLLRELCQRADVEKIPCTIRPKALEQILEIRVKAEDEGLADQVVSAKNFQSRQETAAQILRDEWENAAVEEKGCLVPSEAPEKDLHASLSSKDTAITVLSGFRDTIQSRPHPLPEKMVETEIEYLEASVKDELAVQSSVHSVAIHMKEEHAQVLGLLPLKYCTSDGHGSIAVNDAFTQRFHPLIKWFQREDSVTLTIKLVDPVGQTCEFFPHRVLYSGTVNDRHYHADLELHNGIIPEKSTWSMKCSTPVIKLMKAEKGFWKMLLKQKSVFVSLDFDHLEEEAENPGSGLCFLEDPGEEGRYSIPGSESASDSDSDS